MAQYEYKPLDRGRDEIRLIRLLPAVFRDGIRIEIFHAQLSSSRPSRSIYPTTSPKEAATPRSSSSDDDARSESSTSSRERPEHKYEALSYVWGSIVNLHTIKVRESSSHSPHSSDNKLHSPNVPDYLGREFTTLRITQNLALALRHLRDSQRPRILWVDAICINQRDLHERSIEVRRMAQIYKAAWRVIVWLGPEGDESTVAMGILQSMGKDVSGDSGRNFLGEDAVSKQARSTPWNAVGRLLRREWFKRLWVYQEIQAAKKCIFIAGSCSLPLRLFRKAIYRFRHALLNEAGPNSDSLDGELIERIFGLISDFGNDVDDVIHATLHTSCLDPKDRVYAVLSLLELPYQQEIRPDYTLPVERVYQDLMVCHIRNSAVISLSSLISGRESIPSWIPDLETRALPSEEFSLLYASGNSKHEILFSEVERSLRVRGIHACTISKVSEAMPNTATAAEMLAIFRRWEPPDLFSAKYIDGSSLFDAFLGTLVGDLTAEKLAFESTMKFLDLEEFRSRYLFCVREKLAQEEFMEFLFRWFGLARGRAFFSTTKGHIGLCLPPVQAGDRVVVALGCQAPLVLRPTAENNGHFQLKGECYIQGLVQSEALLGSLPEVKSGSRPWRVAWQDIRTAGVRRPIFSDGDIYTQNDPRLGPLPPKWRMQFGGEDDDNLQNEEYDSEGDMLPMRFEDLENNDTTDYDPRMTSEALKARGIKIQDFIIV